MNTQVMDQQMEPNAQTVSQWLPITEYAARAGMSISTLRRKIKSNSIPYRMEGGKYLIRCDLEESETTTPETKSSLGRAYFSSDSSIPPPAQKTNGLSREEVRSLVQQAVEEQSLLWRAMDARVAGLAKKIDVFSERLSELKMLVKIFEEKMDERH